MILPVENWIMLSSLNWLPEPDELCGGIVKSLLVENLFLHGLEHSRRGRNRGNERKRDAVLDWRRGAPYRMGDAPCPAFGCCIILP